MYSYSELEKILSSRKINKSTLSTALGISSKTIAKISKGEKISNRVLEKIANYLSCDVSKLCRKVSDNFITQMLTDEKNAKISGGLYHELQIRMTYNSNHMEGSKLSEDQTRLIFETRTINTDGEVLVDDIIETVNHFRAIDYVIDVADDTLTEDIIKKIHFILKQGTNGSSLPWFAVGDYKKRANVVGGKETTKPEDVPQKMKLLLNKYNLKKDKTIDDIIEFHADFESIYPFQDGNGRVGRLIALKECLKFNIVPFIIEDSKKAFYYRGLNEWKQERGYLIDTCLDGQDTFKKLLKMFDITISAEEATIKLLSELSKGQQAGIKEGWLSIDDLKDSLEGEALG